jgi:TPR repeat protein
MRSYDVALKEAYLKRPNWSRVMKVLARAHRGRDARASYALGVLYYFGDHVEVDVRRGLKLIQVGAKRGSLDAQFFIGVALELGWHGWKRNDRRAFSYYIGAGSMGHKFAALSVARCYRNGFACAKDLLAAQAWSRMSKAMVLHAEHLPRAARRLVQRSWASRAARA